jgi:predicted NBD/HSP70 family sugar kinase
MILAGDIGGTKCNLAVFEEHGASLNLIFKRRYATREFASLEELIEKFFRECAAESGVRPQGDIAAAGFGVAGAMVDGRLVANNIPWELTASALARKLDLDLEQLTLGWPATLGVSVRGWFRRFRAADGARDSTLTISEEEIGAGFVRRDIFWTRVREAARVSRSWSDSSNISGAGVRLRQ